MEAAILAALKKIAVKLGQDAKQFDKEVEKGSKKLAKKLSKEMAFNEPAKLEAGKTSKINEPAKPDNTINGAEKPRAAAQAPATVLKATSATKPNPVIKAAPAVKPVIASKPAPAVSTAKPKAKTASKPSATKPKTA